MSRGGRNRPPTGLTTVGSETRSGKAGHTINDSNMIKTLGKILVGLAGLALLLVIAAVIAFKLLADPERIKAEVIALVAEQTGRELTIDGELKLSFVPWLGFEVGAVTLSNEDGFGEEPFAQFESAQARVRLRPLLRKEIEVGTLAVSGLKLDLVSDRSGASNWSDFVSDEDTSEGPDDDEGFRAQGIATIVLDDANIRYRDLASGDDYRLENASLTAGPLVPGEPFDVAFAFRAAMADTLSAQFDGETTVTTDLEAEKATIAGFDTELQLSGEALGAAPVEASLRAGPISYDGKADTLSIADLVIRTLGTTISTSLEGRDISGQAAFSGPLTVKEFVPRRVLAALGFEAPTTADRSALGSAEFSATLTAGTNSLQLDGLKARLDDSAITGSFAVTDIERERLRFDLSIDTLDADRYLPPVEEGGTTGGGNADDEALPVEMIKDLDLSGTLNIGNLSVSGIRSTDVRATIKARNGELRVNPSQAKLYGGQYRGDVRVATRGSDLTISMNEQVSDVQAGELAGDLFERRQLSGAADVNLKLSGRGATLSALRSSLSGNLDFKFTDGYVEGIDLWYEIRRAKALFGKGEAPDAPEQPARTRYTDLTASAVVENGIMRSNDLNAELPFMRLGGQGEINLVDATVDYRLNALVLKKPEVEADAQLAELVGARIPVRIRGDLAAPSVTPDIAAWARNRVEEKVRDKLLGKVLGKAPASAEAGTEAAPAADTEEVLKEELENKVKDKLRGLFGGSKKEPEEPKKDDSGGSDGGGGGSG